MDEIDARIKLRVEPIDVARRRKQRERITTRRLAPIRDHIRNVGIGALELANVVDTPATLQPR